MQWQARRTGASLCLITASQAVQHLMSHGSHATASVIQSACLTAPLIELQYNTFNIFQIHAKLRIIAASVHVTDVHAATKINLDARAFVGLQ